MKNLSLDKEYPWLATIRSLLYVVGILIILSSVIALIVGIIEDETIYIVGGIAGFLVYGVPVLAFAELIKLFARIEFNTRKEEDIYVSSVTRKKELSDSKKNGVSFEQWKKENPNKSLNDYYAEVNKK